MNTYSESFSIGTGGWTGGCNGIMYGGAVSTASGLTADVRLWRDDSATAPRRITLIPGTLLPLKIRYINHNGAAGTVIGFN